MTPGVNSKLLYSAMYGSRFPFGTHIEDLSLASVNLLIHGEPKLWLCVAPADQTKVTTELLCELERVAFSKIVSRTEAEVTMVRCSQGGCGRPQGTLAQLPRGVSSPPEVGVREQS